jgi:phage shock protein A
MWNRLRMLFRSLFGWMIRGAENPELILRQLQDDLRSKVPQLNAQVAEVVKQEKLLDMQLERQTQQVALLRPQVEAAVKAGPNRKEAAKALIMQLQNSEQQLADTQAALVKARANSAQMLQLRTAYEQKVREQMQEAMRQLSRYKQAQVQQEMAQLMGSFEVGDESDTLNRMTEKVDESLARSEARMQVASTSVDSQISQVKLQAANDSADFAYEEYQRKLGLVPETPETEAPVKTMDSIPLQAAAPPPMPPETVKQEDRSTDANWAQSNTDTQR